MKIPLALTLVVACAAGAAEARRPPAFEASGSSPGWQLTVMDDAMILSFGPDGIRPGVTGEDNLIGGVRKRPRQEDGALGWEAGKKATLMVVEARLGDCVAAAGKVLAYRVTVHFENRTPEGCGSVPAPRNRR